MLGACPGSGGGRDQQFEAPPTAAQAQVVVGFTVRYNVNRLGDTERYSDVTVAIAREKQVEGCSRVRKVAVIEAANRDWKDLSAAWE